MSFSAQSSFGRGSMFLLLLLHAASASSCDEALQHDVVCTMDYNNLLSSSTTILTVTGCQEKCLHTDGCDHFTFFTTAATKPSSTVCALLRSCETSTPCSSFQNCTKALSGAKTPSISDACCSGLSRKMCKGNFLSQHFQIAGPEQCQGLCQEYSDSGCRYFTHISGGICFLYSTCNATESCSTCTSGPVDPTWEECNSEVDPQTLLLGGWTQDGGSYSSSLELVTENIACQANMPELPEGRQNFAATLLGKTLLYCGGCSSPMGCDKNGDCYTFQLDRTDAVWETSASMNIPRYHFSMVAVQGKAYAIGGMGTFGTSYTGHSVEEYSPGEGWIVQDKMRHPSYIAYHCTVTIGRRIITIGGHVSGASYSHYVYEFDLDAPEKSWTRLENTNYGRQYHSCTVGSYQGQHGIFVTGGSNSGNTKVEFFVDSLKKWRILRTMSTDRRYHSSSFMGGVIYSLGGDSSTTSKSTHEMLNKTTDRWTRTNLRRQRSNHAGISLPAGTLTCFGGDNLG